MPEPAPKAVMALAVDVVAVVAVVPEVELTVVI
jgi:hypothetical protein